MSPAHKKLLTRSMRRTALKNLRIDTDNERLISINRTPPLQPPSPMVSTSSPRDASSCGSNTFPASKMARFKQRLKDDWAAGINDPHSKQREVEEEARAPKSTPRPSATPSKKSEEGQYEHEKVARLTERQQSAPQKVEEELGFPSPRFAPLRMLEEANNARHQALQADALAESNPAADTRAPSEGQTEYRTYLNYRPRSPTSAGPYFPWQDPSQSPQRPMSPHSDRDVNEAQEKDYDPYQFPASQNWTSPGQPPRPEPQRRGEFETILNRMIMPDQTEHFDERNTYQTHVTRRGYF